jgi:ribose 5-phosphate isomerase A
VLWWDKGVNLKQQAASQALTYVRSGMALGLGSGSTTVYFVEMLGERLNTGSLKNIVGVPTSEETASRAQDLGIPLTNLTAHPRLDLVVDGADEVDPDLNLIKGLGRALLREKIVECHAERFLVIVDESKLVTRLGTGGPLPVEIVQFEAAAHVRWLNTLGCRAELWLEQDGSPVATDNGNYLARCWFADGIEDPYALARALADRPGIVEHGLFLGMASAVIVAASKGVRILGRPS